MADTLENGIGVFKLRALTLLTCLSSLLYHPKNNVISIVDMAKDVADAADMAKAANDALDSGAMMDVSCCLKTKECW